MCQRKILTSVQLTFPTSVVPTICLIVLETGLRAALTRVIPLCTRPSPKLSKEERATEEMAAWPTYPIAACARGVVADIRIVRVVRATAGTPFIAIDEGLRGLCTDLGRPIPNRRLARKGGRGGRPIPNRRLARKGAPVKILRSSCTCIARTWVRRSCMCIGRN